VSACSNDSSEDLLDLLLSIFAKRYLFCNLLRIKDQKMIAVKPMMEKQRMRMMLSLSVGLGWKILE
jgi:hypothetical protein